MSSRFRARTSRRWWRAGCACTPGVTTAGTPPRRCEHTMALALPRLTTYGDYLDLHAREQPSADAVWHAGRTLSYRDLAEQVARMADALAAAGVEAGDRVAVLCTPRPEYLVSLLAA